MTGGFWAIHAGLHREGPGTEADVAWVCAAAGVQRNAALCDAACGPGADIAALRAAAPDGTVTAFDRHLPFVGEAARRHRRDERVTVTQGTLVGPDEALPDPVDLGPFDLVWCAGAAYFVGVPAILGRWSAALRPVGAVAFSEPVTFGTPDRETRAFWQSDVHDEASLDAAIHAAGWGVVARSRVSDAGWEAYYGGIEERCDALARCAAPAIRQAVEAERREIAAWRRLRDRVGYALRVVRPL
ncbi:class I SAM-dependent methyltransferase [Jannaschia sp. W003]|uniref:class I SAM-dependent methyltransferase n=1 Tax=Jannaschia sp. W003 TaxID=2867012 RepID=UPI0021A2C9E8|nr:class I SAM-dependent methyltransferase [Jannaschia sp. W003]UWQ20299.1 class I SAM-dependent methyltransferase [Jannaschia sp. W003]